jgi:hypothetical protein
MLVTERPGRHAHRRAATAACRAPLAGLPPVAAGGQGGLLDVALHPKFADNRPRLLELRRARRRRRRHGGGARPARRRAPGRTCRCCSARRPRCRAAATTCGSRLVFARDGRLFVARWATASHRKDDAQNPGQPPGQDRAHRGRRPRAGRQPLRRASAGAATRGLEPTATATCRAPRCTRSPASSGPPSTAPRAATSSTCPRPERNHGWPLAHLRPQLRHQAPASARKGPNRACRRGPPAEATGCRPRSRPVWPGLPHQRPLWPGVAGPPLRRRAARRGAAPAGRSTAAASLAEHRAEHG